MAHVTQSGLDFGLGVQVTDLRTFEVALDAETRTAWGGGTGREKKGRGTEGRAVKERNAVEKEGPAGSRA